MLRAFDSAIRDTHHFKSKKKSTQLFVVSMPLPERRPETAASASPMPEPLPSRPLDPPAPLPSEAPVRLGYPYNTMNPADVPEEVWQRVRAAKRNG